MKGLLAREPVRVYLYGILVPLAAVLVALGLIGADNMAAYLTVAAAVLGLGVPAVETARNAVTPAPAAPWVVDESPPRHLEATAPPAELTWSAASDPVQVDVGRRIISGVIIPPGNAIGRTTAGPTRFAPNALTWGADLRRIKLLREHNQADSLGYAMTLTWSADSGLVGSFHVPAGENGDRALAEALNGVRDGFSVGAGELNSAWGSDGILYVAGGIAREVSLCSVPAYDDSRVTSVAASHHPEGPLMPCDFCGHTHAPGQTECAPAHLRAALTLARQPAPPAVVPPTPPAAPAPPGPAGAPGPTTLTASELLDSLRTMLAQGDIRPVPVGAPPPAVGAGDPAGPRDLDLAGFIALTAAAMGPNGGGVTELRAALSDIIPGPGTAPAFRPLYLAELWTDTPYVRKFINNAVTPRPLPRTMKIIAHRWVTRPIVDDYAGNKTDVPSNEPVMEDFEATVKRVAGAHDVDRIFVDLGDPAWLQSYFEGQTESYARKSDQLAATQTWTDAVALVDAGPDATPATFDTLLEGVIQAVVELAGIGESVEYVAMAPGLIKELFDVTNMEAPAFFSGSFSLGAAGDGALGGVVWFTTPALPAGGFLVGSKSGTRWHELDVPIKVQAVNVAQGGIDLGVFGYYATYQRDQNQTRKGSVGV